MGKRRSAGRSKGSGSTTGEHARRALLAVAGLLASLQGRPARARNPINLHSDVTDPGLEEISRRFHGTPGEVAILDDDQRQPPPREVVVIGEEVAVAYKPDSHSRRGGIEWEHQAGDVGEGKPRRRGKRYLVTDGDRVWSVPGTSNQRFDPDSGLMG